MSTFSRGKSAYWQQAAAAPFWFFRLPNADAIRQPENALRA
ncbi:hypothetical protein [Kingella sp. (in: b-proteobacteria)]|nr:hypothetical protein [Kingella sp. (in: b-proteobacteria)]MDO4656510.1 hypothetical protein [Kingella sp. (in: b-proteobacteria)]